MFCPECGTRLEDDDLFCPECGTRVREAAESNSTLEASTPCTDTDAASIANAEKYGYILTNSHALAQRLHVPTERITRAINAYCEQQQSHGLAYTVLDIDLPAGSAWWQYADQVWQVYHAAQQAGRRLPEYLFIIGGNEDIPMATIPNPIWLEERDYMDKTVDTDLLYAYPYGKDMEKSLLDFTLFRYDALYYIGRLPIAKDGECTDLERYLRTAASLGARVPVKRSYSQCDPHWAEVTHRIYTPLRQAGLSLQYDLDIPYAYQQRILLSPPMLIQDGQSYPSEYLAKDAQYFVFNMHGGEGRTDCGFFGQEVGGQERWCVGMMPEKMGELQDPNIFCTLACYGGRHIGYNKKESMLLSAISHQTMVYVGSSRVAWGGVDCPHIKLSNSDILTLNFNEHMLAGCTSGEALFAAKIQVFKSHKGGTHELLTIIEFNLYGDPMMRIGSAQGGSKGAGLKAMVGAQETVTPVRSEVLMNKSVGQEQSLLDRLRGAVDQNIMAISQTIAKNLYAQYNIPAREPKIMVRKCYEDGRQELETTYDIDRQQAHVVSDEQGNIQQVSTTK